VVVTIPEGYQVSPHSYMPSTPFCGPVRVPFGGT
jgi:hypothetical protein